MSDNWIVQNLNSALQTWSDKLAEIWTLLTQSPENFKGGAIWSVMTNINGGLKAIGYGLLVLFFAAGLVKTCGSFTDMKKPEHVVKAFIRFALAQGAVMSGSGTLHLSIQHSKTLDFIRAFGILKFLKLVQGADRGQTIKLIFWQSADYLFPVTF